MALVSATLVVSGTVLAVHDNGLFELGPNPPGPTNIVPDTGDPGPDWDDLFDANPTPAEIKTAVSNVGGLAGAFLKDDLAQQGLKDTTTFSGAGGSNKNNDFLNDTDAGVVNGDTWHWDQGAGLPPKDDLANVYAYSDLEDPGTPGDPTDDHLIFYAGLERLDPSGDSYVDLEFFQSKVGLDELAPCNDPGNDAIPCHFTGTRTINDLIVSMNFTNGGAIGSIEVRRWNGTEYILEIALVGEGCNDTTPQHVADTLCGFNNASSIDGGEWPNFDNHNAVITTLPANAFTEFGVDVTEVIGGDPCVTTVMAKTRSSASFTSELKDFAGPQPFEICSANIQIAGTATNPIGVQHVFTVTVNKTLGSIVSPVPDGTIVDVDLTPNPSNMNFSVVSDNCASAGTVNGQCTVTINSNSAGTITAHATATVDVGGTDVTVQTDGLGGNSGDAVKTYISGAIRILKNSTKGGAVNNAGAAFAVDGEDAGTAADFTVTDNVSANDEDSDIGEVCVDGLIPGDTYTVTETTAPPGYGAASLPVPNTVDAVSGDCPAGGAFNAVTFTNPPLVDIQIRWRDGGSGETSLVIPLDCNNTTGTESTAETTGWGAAPPPAGDTLTITGIAIDPSPQEITCTFKIDP
jgi:hypothetical protein